MPHDQNNSNSPSHGTLNEINYFKQLAQFYWLITDNKFRSVLHAKGKSNQDHIRIFHLFINSLDKDNALKQFTSHIFDLIKTLPDVRFGVLPLISTLVSAKGEDIDNLLIKIKQSVAKETQEWSDVTESSCTSIVALQYEVRAMIPDDLVLSNLYSSSAVNQTGLNIQRLTGLAPQDNIDSTAQNSATAHNNLGNEINKLNRGHVPVTLSHSIYPLFANNACSAKSSTQTTEGVVNRFSNPLIKGAGT